MTSFKVRFLIKATHKFQSFHINSTLTDCVTVQAAGPEIARSNAIALVHAEIPDIANPAKYLADVVQIV
ncbi:MAG: hypothetical protein AB3X44_11515 [Leptothrix sp. (in: b-proteobacteria)]